MEKYGEAINNDISNIHKIIINSSYVSNEFIELYGQHFWINDWLNVVERRKKIDTQFIDLFIKNLERVVMNK